MLGLDCVNAKYRNELIKTYNLDSPEETGLESVGRYHSESSVDPLRVV